MPYLGLTRCGVQSYPTFQSPTRSSRIRKETRHWWKRLCRQTTSYMRAQWRLMGLSPAQIRKQNHTYSQQMRRSGNLFWKPLP